MNFWRLFANNMEVFITLLFCMLGLFIYIAYKKDSEVESLKEKIRTQTNVTFTGNFVSVSFKESDFQVYDYFIGDNDLKVGDRVEVPFRDKITGKKNVKVATVKYVSQVGERSNYAKSNVIRKVDTQMQLVKEYKSNSAKIFVKVIFEKDAEKSYDYLVGDFDVKVGDFVVVRTGNINSGKARLTSAQVIYISAPGEISSYAKTPIIKKADYNKW